MVSTVEVYGASDDLIEINGDLTEEFTLPGSDEALLAFSEGTVLRIKYTPDGIWRIAPVANGMATYTITQGTDVDNDYTDRVFLTLGDDIEWVVLGTDVAWRNKERG